jgi:hypothetical protein
MRRRRFTRPAEHGTTDMQAGSKTAARVAAAVSWSIGASGRMMTSRLAAEVINSHQKSSKVISAARTADVPAKKP